MDDSSLSQEMDLSGSLCLSPSEQGWIERAGDKLSFKSNPYYMNLARMHEGIRRQVIPLDQELNFKDYESPDPLAEDQHSPLPRMVHRYANRVAVLVTDRCSVHCRHCFRRSFTGRGHEDLSSIERDAIISYLKEHTEVQEVLLTGGDPLTLGDDEIRDLLKSFREVRPDLLIRLATRIPAVLPMKIDDSLTAVLSEAAPLWMVMQFNHPAELTDESRRALSLLRNTGIPMVNQSVLLRGVNDDSDTLAALFQGLLVQGVKPYYLFQGDLARGTSHLRVPLAKGWQIMDELRQKVSGLALPTYAVDLPGGGGKIPLTRSLLVREEKEGYVFRNADHREYLYPREDV